MKYPLILALGLLLSPPLLAQHRCVEGNRTIITNSPCSGDPAPSPSYRPEPISSSESTGYASSSGAWRGQVQFMARAGTAVINEAHAVVPFVIEIDPKGKVTGRGNGCSFMGITSPSSDVITHLDVTLTNCPFPGFNRQMKGHLALYKAKKHVEILLQSYDLLRRPSSFYELKGTLRR